MGELLGMPLKVATEDDMERIRREGDRIVTGERGFRMVSYYSRATNEILISHTFETIK